MDKPPNSEPAVIKAVGPFPAAAPAEAPPPYFSTMEMQPMSGQGPPLSAHLPTPGPSYDPSQAYYPGQVVVHQPVPFQGVAQNPNNFGINDALQAVLGSQERLTFRSTSQVGCCPGPVLMTILDNQGQPVMSSLANQEHHNHGHGDNGTTHTTTTITFMDVNGQILLTDIDAGNGGHTVYSGGRIVGIVSGGSVCSCFNSNWTVQSAMGQVYFELDRNGTDFKFLSNGSVIATAGKDATGEFELAFNSPLDVNTRAMLLVVAYNCYILYVAPTQCGCSGTMQMVKCFFIGFGIFFLTICMIVGVSFAIDDYA